MDPRLALYKLGVFPNPGGLPPAYQSTTGGNRVSVGNREIGVYPFEGGPQGLQNQPNSKGPVLAQMGNSLRQKMIENATVEALKMLKNPPKRKAKK